MEARTINNSPEIVAFAFVDLYYRVLQKFTNQAHRFYKENSVLSWPFHREIESVKSSEEINEFIISSHFKDKKVEVINIDSQSSTGGGVLVLVTACLIEQDNLRKNFSQTFFLAPQENGYYVLNDIFRFVGVVESSALVDEKVDENALVAPLATESKVEDTIKEVFDNSEIKVTKDDQVVQKPSLTSNEKEKFVAEMAPVVQNEAPKLSYASIKEVSNNSETKMTTNDQVDQKPSLTSNDKEKSVVETAPVVQNEAPKLSYASIKEVSDNSETKVTTDDQVVQKPSLTSNGKEKSVAETSPVVQNEALKPNYASMMKQGRSSPSANTPYKNVRVVAEDGLLSTPKRSEASGLVQALTSSPSCVSKAATASTNVAQGQYKSIYIGGLPTNTTRSDLYAIVKEFGLIDIQDVQLKTYEDGYCIGFVHFQDEISAKKAVQTRYITVKGREVYIRYKRLNKGCDVVAIGESLYHMEVDFLTVVLSRKDGIKILMDTREKVTNNKTIGRGALTIISIIAALLDVQRPSSVVPLISGSLSDIWSCSTNDFIILSHIKDKIVEVINIDSRSSAGGGVLVASTKSKINDTIKEVSDNSENTVTTDDQVVQKSSLTSNEKEKSVVEMALVVQNEASKLSYASMMKQGRSSPPTNTLYKNVRVVADDGLLSTPKKPRASSPVQALTSSSSGVLKAATVSTNFAQGNVYDDFRYKSIYIGGLPTNTIRSDLCVIVKEFVPIDIQDVQLKTSEDGYCIGFVHFQDEISAKKVVQVGEKFTSDIRDITKFMARGQTLHHTEVDFTTVVLSREAGLKILMDTREKVTNNRTIGGGALTIIIVIAALL
ncbi:nuclear transport factor 2-like [Capsicum galapagoense]